jgi:hypothetical protein
MQDAKFSVEQAWSAQLIFFDGLARLREDQGKAEAILPGDFSLLVNNMYLSGVHIGAFFSLVNMDQECFDEWCFCYRTMCKKSSDDALLSSEEALSLMIEFVTYFRCRLGLEISLLLDLLQRMKNHPSASIEPLTLWGQALQRAADGELLIQRDSDALLPFAGSFQVPFHLTFEIAGKFLELTGTELYSISANVKERTQSFLSAFSGDPGTEEEWEECYTMACHKPNLDQTMLTSQELFSTARIFTAWYCYQFGYSVFELMELLNMMRCKPSLYEEKWRLWRQAIQEEMDLEKAFYDEI